jgi:hypothetical protein
MEYLACVIENERWRSVWTAYEQGMPRKDVIALAGSTNVANLWLNADKHIRNAAREWGWGVESVGNRRQMANAVAHVSASLGDGSDEVVAAAKALALARHAYREARQASAVARARSSAALDRVMDAERIAREVAMRLLAKIERGL